MAGPDSEVQENAREGGQQTADKVRHTDGGNVQFILLDLCNIVLLKCGDGK